MNDKIPDRCFICELKDPKTQGRRALPAKLGRRPIQQLQHLRAWRTGFIEMLSWKDPRIFTNECMKQRIHTRVYVYTCVQT